MGNAPANQNHQIAPVWAVSACAIGLHYDVPVGVRGPRLFAHEAYEYFIYI
jgi:hypothetical protein